MVIPHERGLSVCEPRTRSQTVRTENTYQMEPTRVFMSFRAKRAAEAVVSKFLHKDTAYSQQFAVHAATIISREVLVELKAMKYERYRYVAQTFIGQKRGQGIEVSSKSLTNTHTDTFADYSFENRALYCVVTMHALYME